MGVPKVRELFQKRRSEVRDGVSTTVRHWQVVCDSVGDGPAAAITAPGIPKYNGVLPNSSLFSGPRVTSLTADPVDQSDVAFEVVAEYTSPELVGLPVHPLDRPATFAYSSQEFTEPYFLDESKPDRKAFTNSAGDPFEQTWEREQSDLVITMSRPEAYFDVNEASFYKQTTNADPVVLDGQFFQPNTLRLGLATATPKTEEWLGNEMSYFDVSRTFKAREGGWLDEPVDYGFNELVDRPTPSGVDRRARIPICDDTGLKTTRPWPLDGEGRALPSPADQPAKLSFRPYRSEYWAGLLLT